MRHYYQNIMVWLEHYSTIFHTDLKPSEKLLPQL